MQMGDRLSSILTNRVVVLGNLDIFNGFSISIVRWWTDSTGRSSVDVDSLVAVTYCCVSCCDDSALQLMKRLNCILINGSNYLRKLK